MYQLLLLSSLFLLAAQMDADSLPSHSPPFQSGIDDTHHHQSLISRYVRQAPRRICDNNDRNMTVDEIIRACDYISMDYNFAVKNVNIAEWNDFTANLQSVFVLIIMNNPELASISFEDNVDILMGQGGITIAKNDKLETLYFGNNVRDNNNQLVHLTIRQNRKLKTFGTLERFNNTDLVIRGNPILENAVLLQLQQLPNPKNKARDIQQFGECIFDEELVDLSDLLVCQLVEGDLKLAKDAKGSAGSTVLPRVNGSVYLTDPKEDVDLGFLNGTTIAGSIVCRFDDEIANLGQLKFCKIVEGDLQLAKEVNGSAGSAVLSNVNGNVYLKDAKEEKLGFLKGTKVTGRTESWILESLHGVIVTKLALPTPAPSMQVTPGQSVAGNQGNAILQSTWFISSTSVVGGLVLLAVGGILFYFGYLKKKLKKVPTPVVVAQKELEIAARSEPVTPEPEEKKTPGPVPHVPLELRAIGTVYDSIRMNGEQKDRLLQLVEEILSLNPLEFMKERSRLKYTLYMPALPDSLGEKMAKSYKKLEELYRGWSPAFPVVPVDKVQQDPATGKVSQQTEAKKLWDAVVGRPASKKVALCLWSHDDLDSAFLLLAPFLAAESAEEQTRIEAEQLEKEKHQREVAGKGRKKKIQKRAGPTKRGPAGAGGKKPADEVKKTAGVRCNFRYGDTVNYGEYLYKKYEPAGTADEGMVTVFPFYFIKERKQEDETKTYAREQLSFVVASAWMARALGEDKYLTFRALHWAEKQRNGVDVCVLCDKAEHQEENVLIAQCLYDHIMKTDKNERITFLGACRLICAGKQKSWDNGNMLLFLQRNILFWAVDAGVLKVDDKRFINWDNIYRCMLLRSQATPATRFYDPDNLPCPKDLWSIPYEGNEKKLAPLYTNDYEPKKPNGIWRCDLGKAAPAPRTMAGYLGAPEPARYIDKPIGFEAAWGAGALFDGGTQDEGKTVDSGTLATGDGKSGKKTPAPVKTHAMKTIEADAQYVMATSANAKKNKWTKPLRLPKKLKLDQGTSERERRNMNAATGSGKEFEGYRLGSDIDHFCYQATMEFSEYIRPQARPHQWAREDVSQRLNKSKNKKMVSVKKM